MACINYRAKYDKNVTIVNFKDYKNDFLYDEESDKYFSDINEMDDWYRINKWDMPKFAYGCKFYKFELNLEHVLESEADDHHEDILDCIDGVSELRLAIEKFNKDNEQNGSYSEDYMTIVELQ